MTSRFPQIEILKFSVSDAFKQDPTVLNDFLDRVLKAPGVADVWHGPEVQDESIHYVVVRWAFKNDPSTYAPLGIKDALAPAYKELHFVHYTHFGNADAVPALGAPITEFAIANVKEGVDVARVDEATNDLVAKIIAAIPDEATPGGRGTIVGEPRKFVICLGWHSVERFYGSIKGKPELVEAVTAVRELVDLELKHTKLTKYSKN